LRRLVGADTHTGWLTERVWEPSLAGDLVDGGIGGGPLDDRHFLSAGLAREELGEAFVTEYQGKPLVVAPAAEALRQAIPWRSVRECIALIGRMASSGVELAVFGDDMEKFGLWPRTYRSVVRAGWLRRFFTGLARSVTPLSWFRSARRSPRRRRRGASTSRTEVTRRCWPGRCRRTPARAGACARPAQARAPRRRGRSISARGVYFQFLAKYRKPTTSTNALSTSALAIRRARRRRRCATKSPRSSAATRAVWRAQANCVYWHGWFGGTYLPHLRQANWRSLLRAEQLLVAAGERRGRSASSISTPTAVTKAVVTNDTLTLVVDPAEGGTTSSCPIGCAL